MRIAFASYEFPEETGGGGIGTYLRTITQLLVEQGHSIVVFTGTKKTEAFWENEHVYRLPSQNWKELNELLPRYFLPLHAQHPFDVMECTDFEACGLSVKKILPAIPVVVRLHTPLYLVDKLLFRPLSFVNKLRFVLGGLKKFKLVTLPSGPKPDDYSREFELIKLAEVISSPSHSIADEMRDLGFTINDKTEIVPLPFDLKNGFEQLQAREQLDATQIVFVGRLELRKGVIDLADAIPTVLKKYPNARFSFIGGASQSPQAGVDMIAFLRNKLKSFGSSVRFTGKVARAELLSFFNEGDIFVFPSHYESFGLVCCEAMSAGKAVIGSKSGGMAEIIEDGKSGILIQPKNPAAIASAIMQLIEDNNLRLGLGKAARQRIKNYLSPAVVIEKQMTTYHKAIAKSRPAEKHLPELAAN